MSAESVQVILSLREHIRDEDEAQRLAWEHATALVGVVRAHIENRNYGFATDELDELLDMLPNVHGGPVTHFRLLDAKREIVADRRRPA